MTKLQGTLYAIGFAPDDDIRSQKAKNSKITAQFLAIPNLPMLCFKRFAASLLLLASQPTFDGGHWIGTNGKMVFDPNENVAKKGCEFPLVKSLLSESFLVQALVVAV